MKKSYNKKVTMRCISCGDTNFEYNDDKTWIKCNRCGREYNGGYDELLKLNQNLINDGLKKTTDEVTKDLERDIKDMFKKAFKGNKNIKFK